MKHLPSDSVCDLEDPNHAGLRRREFLRAAGAGAAAILTGELLPGCGGGGSGGDGSGGGSGGGGGGGGGTSSNAALQSRGQIASGLSALYATLPHADVDTDNQTMLTWLKVQSVFEATGQVSSGSIWARFKDNGEVMVVCNDGSVQLSDLTKAATRAAIPHASRGATELPAGQNIYLFNNIGAFAAPNSSAGDAAAAWLYPVAQLHVSNIQSALQSSTGPNYKNVLVQSGTPSTLKSVKQADVLYMYGHGGFGINRSSDKVFVLNTALPYISIISPLTLGMVDIQNRINLASDIEAGRVGMMMYVDGVTPPKLTMKPYYYITPDFIRTYMTFNSARSFVFINGCASASPTLAADLMAAFEQVGTTVYAGWDNLVSALEVMPSADILFTGLSGVQVDSIQLSPPDRPFDWSDLLPAMQQQMRSGASYSFAQSMGHNGLADLQINELQQVDQDFGLLAPSIAKVSVDEQQGQLFIDGEFGNVAPTVTVGGQAVSVSSSGPGTITCSIPQTGAGSSGDVVVSVNGHHSNPVPLTLWNCQVTAKIVNTSNNLTITLNYTLVFRADVHGYRQVPFQTPQQTGVTQDARSDAKCSWQATGLYNFTEGDGTMATTFWSGSGSLPYSFSASGGNAGFTAGLVISSDLKSFSLDLSGFAPNAIKGEVYEKGDLVNTIYTNVAPAPDQLTPTTPIKMSLDSQFNVTGSQIGPATFEGYQVTASWNGFSAADPPTSNTPRAARA